MTPVAILFLVLGLFVVFYAAMWIRGVNADGAPKGPATTGITIGVVLGAAFGWAFGGGIKIVNNELVYSSPFGDALNSTMIVAIVIGVVIGVMLGIVAARARDAAEYGGRPKPIELGISFVANFFDTLGIGSFATTTSMIRFFKGPDGKQLVDDRLIPGTLNVGYVASTIAQALIFIAIVEVDFTTLALLLAASVLGAWLGAGVVAKWPRRNIQVGMGFCLLGAATLMLLTLFSVSAGGGTDIGLTGVKLGIGIAGNFMLGALMTLGIGLYAPCLIMISLLGMNPIAAFPIMMGSCAFLMPVASARFIKEKSYALRPALSLAIGGIPAVLIAAFIVKSLPLTYVRWLVVVVVLYTAISMLRAARASAPQGGVAAA